MKFKLIIIFLFITLPNFAQETFIPYRSSKLWGYADTNGIVKIKPEYTSVAFRYKDGRYIVEKENKYGLINQKGEILIDIIYKDVSSASGNDGYITTLEEKKCGYISKDGEIIIKNEYDGVYSSRKGILYLSKGKYEFKYDLALKQIIDTIADEFDMDMEVEEDMYFYSDTTVRWKYTKITKKGKEGIAKHTKTSYYKRYRKVEEISIDTINKFYDEVKIINYSRAKFVLIRKKEKWGLFYNDKVIIPIKYDEIATDPIPDKCKEFFFKVRKKEKWGLMDEQGDRVLPFIYDSITLQPLIQKYNMNCVDLAMGLPAIIDKKHGIVGLDGTTILDFKYSNITYSKRSRWFLFYTETKKGIYSPEIKTDAIFELSDRINTTKINNFKLFIVSDPNIKMKGYVSLSGIFFYDEGI